MEEALLCLKSENSKRRVGPMALSRSTIAAVLLGTALCLPGYAQDNNQSNQAPEGPAQGTAPTMDLENPDLDADPLTKDQVTAVKKSIDSESPNPEGTFDPNNPPEEVRSDVDARLDDLKQQYDDMQKKYEELDKMRREDKAAYNKRVEELERSLLETQIDSTKARIDALEVKNGMAQKLNQVNTRMSNPNVNPGTPNNNNMGQNPGYGYPNNGYPNNGYPNNGYPNNGYPSQNPNGQPTSFPPPSTGPNAGLPSNTPAKKPTWWERLLTKAAEGVGKGLGKLFKKELGKVRDKADAFIKEEGDKHPKYKSWIAKAIRTGADNILSGKYADKNSGNNGSNPGNQIPGNTIPGFPGNQYPGGTFPGQNPNAGGFPGQNPNAGGFPGQNPGNNPVIINNGGTVIINNGGNNNQYHPRALPPIPPSPKANRSGKDSNGRVRLSINISLGG
jgi:hypothetical protein